MSHSKTINNIFIVFIKGVLAGIAIGIGGWLYLKTREISHNFVLASFLFSIGLILICNFGFFLYTGKICYLFKKENAGQKPIYLIQLLVGIIGNYLGALLMGTIYKLVNSVPEFVYQMIDAKVNCPIGKLLVLGIFCGMLIYFAVEGFAKIENQFGKYVVLILCVAGFIICGFEHCIANMFYLSIDHSFTVKSVLSILMVVIGNSIGGLFIPCVTYLLTKCKGNEA